MSKIKVAVIGCGSIARRRHLVEYANNDNVEIIAVCDIVESRAVEMAEKYEAQAFTQYEKVVQLAEVDVISVCLPNDLHAPVSIAALNAGKNVLCEKPMATSRKEAEEMIEAAEKNNKTLMIAHNQRFVSSHQKARQIIESGELGKIYSFRTTFGHPGPERWSIDGRNSWFFDKERAFIGALGDLGVHKSDLIRYLLGDVAEVSAFVETSAKEDTLVDDNAIAILKMESGVIGTLTASWSYVAGGDNSTVIYAENAVLRLEDDPDHSLIVQYNNGEVVKHQLDKIQTNDEGGQTNTHVIDHFIDSILNKKAPLINGEEGKKSLEVILAALEANETKKVVMINKIPVV
ncbi:Gfo/Idh/MocA family oxidoreductase [Metabacillus litoralis]|uniref:Gfo/Idh/MocA family protein n=1 Tax=Metabacillus TaxID=2675233 RepID=UPI001B9C5F13|nr:Gfo/Idh/MocA family oxidoreductase [Metabacillus litoralis]MCM3408525.1 Gfo/Idh/MocA family oxidoreductase [Metabacillus litoralis]UHA59809.1 Gfo/Idh/MocA family oxidoreductase [Metabacillus litoralis]